MQNCKGNKKKEMYECETHTMIILSSALLLLPCRWCKWLPTSSLPTRQIDLELPLLSYCHSVLRNINVFLHYISSDPHNNFTRPQEPVNICRPLLDAARSPSPLEFLFPPPPEQPGLHFPSFHAPNIYLSTHRHVITPQTVLVTESIPQFLGNGLLMDTTLVESYIVVANHQPHQHTLRWVAGFQGRVWAPH